VCSVYTTVHDFTDSLRCPFRGNSPRLAWRFLVDDVRRSYNKSSI
jgi:hypothetical protein